MSLAKTHRVGAWSIQDMKSSTEPVYGCRFRAGSIRKEALLVAWCNSAVV